MANKLKILLIEDDIEISRRVEQFLLDRCFDVYVALTGEAGLEQLADNQFHAIVLDLCLPDRYGIEICREVKQNYHVPVLILSAESGEQSPIVGLQAGADDYVEKPFNPHELYIKLNKLIELYAGAYKGSVKRPSKMVFAGWSLDLIEGTLYDNYGVETVLTQSEFEILRLLVENSHQLHSREDITEHLSGEKELASRSIDVHITHIREKLGQAGLIKSVRSHGYVFVGKVEVFS